MVDRGDAAGNGRRYRVAFVVWVGRTRDRDNLIWGLKYLRDAIAASLGCDDADGVIEWTYGQVVYRGRNSPGVTVCVDKI